MVQFTLPKNSKIRTGKSAGRLKGQFFLEDQQGAVLVPLLWLGGLVLIAWLGFRRRPVP